MENDIHSNMPPTEAPPHSSLAGRMLNVVVSPGEAFDDLKPRDPTAANWLVPGILFVLITWIGVVILFTRPWTNDQILDLQSKAMQQQVEKGKMTQEQADQALEMMARWGRVGAWVGGIGAPVFVALIGPPLWALAFWGFVSRLLKADLSYRRALEIAGLALVIAALAGAIKTLLILVTGDLMAAVTAAYLLHVPAEDVVRYSLFALIDPLAWWSVGIMAFGISRVSARPLGPCALWTGLVWIVFRLLLMIPGLIGQALSNR